jgi:hypothetical protein
MRHQDPHGIGRVKGRRTVGARVVGCLLGAGLAWAAMAMPVSAIPLEGDYIFVDNIHAIHDQEHGSFHSNGLMLTSWDIHYIGLPSFSSLDTAFPPTINNDSDFSQTMVRTFIGPLETFHYSFKLDLNWLQPTYNFIWRDLDTGELQLVDGDFVAFIQVTGAPEPATILLMATGLLGLAGYVWRQRRPHEVPVG